MKFNLVEDSEYKYIEEGEGFPIIILHGLMGNLSNFNEVTDFFKNRNFKVIMPVLPIYDMPLLKTSVKELAKFLDKFTIFFGINSKKINLNSKSQYNIHNWYLKKIDPNAKIVFISKNNKNIVRSENLAEAENEFFLFHKNFNLTKFIVLFFYSIFC